MVGFGICVPNLSGAVITSGYIDLPSFASPATFSLSGNGIAAAGEFAGPSVTNWEVFDCFPCSPGFSLPVLGAVCCTDFAAPWNDPDAAVPSLFQVTGPSILVSGPGTYTGTFSFTGSLCSTAGVGSPPHPCITNLPVLIGSGEVRVTIVQVPGSLLQTASARYTFTPEPSTVVLTAIAALILFIGRQKLNAALD